jgi:hypothetical protein
VSDRAPPARLITEPRFPDPDAAYRIIALAHRGLDADRSAALNAALVLILANQIGDMAVLEEAVALARTASGPSA